MYYPHTGQNMHAKPPDMGSKLTMKERVRAEREAGEINVGKGFPERWGPKPARRSKDIVVWPGGYGRGSSTMANWIIINMA